MSTNGTDAGLCDTVASWLSTAIDESWCWLRRDLTPQGSGVRGRRARLSSAKHGRACILCSRQPAAIRAVGYLPLARGDFAFAVNQPLDLTPLVRFLLRDQATMAFNTSYNKASTIELSTVPARTRAFMLLAPSNSITGNIHLKPPIITRKMSNASKKM